MHAMRPGHLVEVFNPCQEGVFPGRWKRARLALLAKPGRSEGVRSSYGLLCLLDDVGKIFEFLYVVQMNSHMIATGVKLSERQLVRLPERPVHGLHVAAALRVARKLTTITTNESVSSTRSDLSTRARISRF
ncbi:uncharacterized protein LOC112596452 [Melanaphis sacchari]|uniref:uncharacterized protein LOC112596452 n=1 Tax=Melanaphis sacchari TaxID=742174 RepID=UPI000DC13FA1|nr:uncharacterized protein LOC112596452 [Melanaphis sacchari]